MRSTFAIGLVAIVGFTAAQQDPGSYRIDPESVRESDRDAWCLNQKSQCPLICLQLDGVDSMTTQANDCDAETLDYSCICENGVEPDISQYVQTIPYYMCTEWGTQCVTACQGENICGSKCRSEHPCGQKTPDSSKAKNSTMTKSGSHSSTTSAAAPSTSDTTSTSTSTAVATEGFGGAQASDTPKKEGAATAMLNLGRSGYGFAVVFGGLAAGFALLL